MKKCAVIKLLIAGMAVILMVSVGVGCGTDGLSTTKIANGDALLSIQYKIESPKVKFDIDDVTLDFSYGHSGNSIGLGQHYDAEGKDNYILSCFAVYFCDELYVSSFTDYVHSDYRSIDNCYFIKEIMVEAFHSDNYLNERKMDLLLRRRTIFSHKEEMTVPRGVFERENGKLAFQVVGINYSIKDKCYIVEHLSFISVYYEYLDSQTIVLS
ncbi:MAG: hypothetical protein FWH42_06250 [Dehalococcoidia bacterium]|nr:hypothetical protein [Dehalococcoidia bacterium]